MEPLIVDAGALYAAADTADPDNEAVVAALETWPGPLVVPAFNAAEADHFILARLGVDTQLKFLLDLAETFQVLSLESGALRKAHAVCAQYRDLELGLADAAIVVLAERLKTRSVATFDRRHFRVVAPLQGGSFRLIPDDL